MTQDSVLVANRGEVAIRVIRAAAESGIRSVAVYSQDDAGAMHQRAADESVPLEAAGPAAYLDAGAMVAAARATGCDLLHPGWGFLSEQPELARNCREAEIRFVGPEAETLEILGDKVRAQDLAAYHGLPVLLRTPGAATLDEAAELLTQVGPHRGIMLKAAAGGGGRGIRAVGSASELPRAYRDCVAEAKAAFGDGRVFAELYLQQCRHIEVQVVGDGQGSVAVVGDRDCSIQRNWQKLIEIAPAPALPASVRASLWDAARRLAEAVRYRSVGTFEFLLDPADLSWWFMEANPRLQVEHTITEQVSGIDLVHAQFGIAAGRPLADLGLAGGTPAQAGTAVQLRLNAERVTPTGAVQPSAGTLTTVSFPSGPGIRIDTAFAAGDVISPRFDSLLAKIIVHAPQGGLAAAAQQARWALERTNVTGVDTNRHLLGALLSDPRLAAGELSTSFMHSHLETSTAATPQAAASPGSTPDSAIVVSGMSGVVTRIEVAVGEVVEQGADLIQVEAMKMQHVLTAPVTGRISSINVREGAECHPDMVLAEISTGIPSSLLTAGPLSRPAGSGDDWMAVHLTEIRDQHQRALGDARPQVVSQRKTAGKPAIRQKLDVLFDGSFTEYGSLAVASRLWRDSEDDLAERTPADGVITGIGQVNSQIIEPPIARAGGRCAVVAYDPAVMAGTQGHIGTQKTARLLELAGRSSLPVVLFADGGGGRPGDDAPGTFSPPLEIFRQFARLSGNVPLVGSVSGACFGGNAALLACCDIIVATRDANVGMAGPAVIEAGGLGSFRIEEIGPASQLHDAGLVDVLADSETAAAGSVRHVLGYFQGPVAAWESPDQTRLRHVLPRNRLRAYDVTHVARTLADLGSVQEIKPAFGRTMMTSLARIDGAPVGIIGNNPRHGAGAIDGDGADKAARFARLCNTFGIPLIFLCDTPGFAVGPSAEATGQLSSFSRMLIECSRLTVPFVTIITRKAYGLGAVAMCGGSYRAPSAVVSWPTAELAGMAAESVVRLSAAKDLAAIDDDAARAEEFALRVDAAREAGTAIRAARRFRVDDVIDPAETRSWVRAALT
jgi:acetyl/propionyl-CoA carboxylase alpha subunit/acetyl-CoA carboxylase carboxyltransferase component